MPYVQGDMRVGEGVLDSSSDMAAIISNNDLRFWRAEQREAFLDSLEEFLYFAVGLGLAELLSMMVRVV